MSPKRVGLNGEDPPHGGDRRHSKEVRIHFPIPSIRPPIGTGVIGASSLSCVLIEGGIPADSPVVWPLVALVLGSMAYDVAVQALKRRDGGRSR
ncbi:hypothetical protein [Streptomyces sp. NPDC001165]|uniref:hypothetical protein n=1 Tax=Streptomyces sp. NPDC001165 TaxID=3364546 RepID=UPI0036994E68